VALNNFGLGIHLGLKDGFTQPSKKARDEMGKFTGAGKDMAGGITGAMSQIGVAFAGLTTAVAPLVALTGLADKAGKFTFELTRVANISGATAEQLDRLRGAAIDAGIATQFSPTEAVQGLQQLASVGLNTEDQIKALVPSLDLAAAHSISVADASFAATSAMKQYNIQTDDLSFALDRMTRITSLTALQGRELRRALAGVGGGAKAAKQGLSEMLIMMGLSRSAGLDVGVASSGISMGLMRMSTTGKKHLADLGVAVGDEAGRFRDFGDILLDLSKATEKQTEVERAATLTRIFGARAIKPAVAIMSQLEDGIKTHTGTTVKGAEALAYYRKELEGSSGTLAKFRERLLDTFEGQKILIKGTLETIQIVLGEPLARAFKPIVKFVTGKLNEILQWFEALPKATKDGIARIAMLAGSLTAVLGAVIALKAAIPLFLPFLGALKVGLGSTMFLMAKMLVPLALLGTAMLVLKKGWEENWGGMRNVVARALGSTKSDMESIKANAVKLGEGFKAGFNDVLLEGEDAVTLFVEATEDLMISIGLMDEKFKESEDSWDRGATLGRALAAVFMAWGEAMLFCYTNLSNLISLVTGKWEPLLSRLEKFSEDVDPEWMLKLDKRTIRWIRHRIAPKDRTGEMFKRRLSPKEREALDPRVARPRRGVTTAPTLNFTPMAVTSPMESLFVAPSQDAKSQPKTVHVTLEVDGEKMAEKVVEIDRENRGMTFRGDAL